MYEIYTTTELATHWDCTSKTARKRAVSEGFKTVPKKVDGKTLEAFKVPENRLEELKQEIHQMKQKYSGASGSYQNHSQNISGANSEYTESSLAKESAQFVLSGEVDEGSGRMSVGYQEGTNTVVEMLEKFETYIYKAGKFDMLEDKSKSQADTIQYLQGEISKLQYQVTQLEKTVTKLETEKEFLQKENENLKKPFWVRKN